MIRGDSAPSRAVQIGAAALLACNAASLCAIYVGVRQYPPFWFQPAAWVYASQTVAMLLVYSGLIVWVSERRGEWWHTVLRAAAAFGIAAAIVDLIGLILEDGIVVHLHGPAMQIGMMLTLFLLWGAAGWRGARELGSIRGGVLTAVLSAAFCMTVAVTAALIVQLFFVRPPIAEVATWGEFKRSGWANPRAFAIANTLDSGFTHFAVAPVVACMTGGIGSVLSGKRGSSAHKRGAERSCSNLDSSCD
jgi:hypothetical protein